MRYDIMAMLWKEYSQFRRNMVNELGLLVVLAAACGVAVPAISLSDPAIRGIAMFTPMLAGFSIFAVYFLTTLMSDGTFGEEIQAGAMRMLLATRLRPVALFTAKWLALMARALVLLIAVALLQLGTVRVRAGNLDGVDAGWMVWGAGMGLLVAAYIAAVNATVSLVAKSAFQLRQLAGLATLLPMLGLVGFGYLIGYGRGAVVFVSALLFVLTIASFFLAIVAFRSEKTRC